MGKLILLFVILGVSLQYPKEIFAKGVLFRLAISPSRASATADRVVCRADEEPLAEPQCTPTCSDPDPGQFCLRMKGYTEYDCKCKEGYVRIDIDNRTCVTPDTCTTLFTYKMG